MGVALHLNKLESPFTLGCFVSSLVEIGPEVPEKIVNCKVYDDNDDDDDGQRTTDKFRSENLTRVFASGELKRDQ